MVSQIKCGMRPKYEGDPVQCTNPKCGYRFKSRVLFPGCHKCGCRRVKYLPRGTEVKA